METKGEDRKPTKRPAAGVTLALSARDAATALGVSVQSFRRYVKAGMLPGGIVLGRRRLWPIRTLEQWIVARERERSATP